MKIYLVVAQAAFLCFNLFRAGVWLIVSIGQMQSIAAFLQLIMVLLIMLVPASIIWFILRYPDKACSGRDHAIAIAAGFASSALTHICMLAVW